MDRMSGDGRFDGDMHSHGIDLDSPRIRDHLQTTVCTWLGLPREDQKKAPILPKYLRSLLLREEEFTIRHRDQWGCWEHGASDNYRRGKLWTAEIDEWVAKERSALAQDGRQLCPVWPSERDFAFVMTHDVDLLGTRESSAQMLRRARQSFVELCHQGGLAPARRIARWLYGAARAAPFESKDLEDTLGYCMNVETDFQINASYFFTLYPISGFAPFDCVYRPSDRYWFDGKSMLVADIMKCLSDKGFDVGLHGSYHSALEDGLLADQRARLEQISGRPVITTRQHWLHYDVAVTPEIQEKAGDGFNIEKVKRSESLFVAKIPSVIFEPGDRIYIKDSLENLQHYQELLDLSLLIFSNFL